MKNTYYLFKLGKEGIYEAVAYSFKEAIALLADYCGLNTDLFNKCISGFEEEDISSMVELFNYMGAILNASITKVYEIDKVLWV